MKNGLINTLIPRYPLARTIFVDANRDPEEEDGGRLEAKERDVMHSHYVCSFHQQQLSTKYIVQPSMSFVSSGYCFSKLQTMGNY